MRDYMMVLAKVTLLKKNILFSKFLAPLLWYRPMTRIFQPDVQYINRVSGIFTVHTYASMLE